jgi:hypothetical protein
MIFDYLNKTREQIGWNEQQNLNKIKTQFTTAILTAGIWIIVSHQVFVSLKIERLRTSSHLKAA